MDLNLVHLVFSLAPDGGGAAASPALDLARRFPGVFREVTCGRAAPCGACPEASGCPWFPLFGQPLSTDPETVRRHQKPPLPFVFAVPFPRPDEPDAADLEIGLTLVGGGVNHAASFIRGVERYCRGAGPGRAVMLEGVVSQGLFGERSAVSVNRRGELAGDLRILAADDIAGTSLPDREKVALTFLSPLRQFREGRLIRSFDVSLFLRGLIRRVSSLAASYGGGELDADFRWLAELSRKIEVTRSSLSETGGGDANSSGLQGGVSLSGDLAPFLPYLFLGEYLHAGKGASWGFGRFRLRRG